MAIDKNKRPLSGTIAPTHGWRVAGLVALMLAVGAGVYVYFLEGTLTTLTAASKVVAGTATLLFALSLGASSISHFTGFPDMRLGYQKYIGVLAFWLAVLYSIMLAASNPERYILGFFENFFTADIALGIIAMGIFASMVFINTKWLAPVFGRRVIFFCFGLGFVAYALLVMRAIWIEWDLWMAWWRAFEGLPPVRIPLAFIATSVLLLRLAVTINRQRKKRT